MSLRVGPEIVLGLAAEPGVLGAPTPPVPIVHERNDQADPLFIGDRQHLVERPEGLLVELPRPQHVARHIRRVLRPLHRQNVGAHHLSPHLPHRGQRIGDLKTVGQPPPRPGARGCARARRPIRSAGLEWDVILDQVQVGNVPRDEAERFALLHQLVAPHANEIAQLGFGVQGADKSSTRLRTGGFFS